MLRRGRKGIGPMLTITIFFVFFGICVFLFLNFFTYTIRVSKTETITKSRESLLVLSIINKHYSSGENFVISLSNDTTRTNEEINNYIIEFNEIDLSTLSSTESDVTLTSIYYYYKFIDAENTVQYISNNRCLYDPIKCRYYTYIIKLPIPQLYDGISFVKEGLFMSFV